MKECKNCEFFEGYDDSDGTPYCACDGGYDDCPYNDESNFENKGMKIEIDTGFMSDYIKHTIRNTVDQMSVSIVREEVKKIITNELEQTVREEVKRQLEKTIADEIAEFMRKDITVGGGWSGPERVLTREQYLAETIEDELKDKFKSDALSDYAKREAKKAIDRYDNKLREDVNSSIKTYFDAATRDILTQNIVTMLMDNSTYQKLSASMATFLPKK